MGLAILHFIDRFHVEAVCRQTIRAIQTMELEKIHLMLYVVLNDGISARGRALFTGKRCVASSR